MNKTNSLDKKASVAQDDATDVEVMVEANVATDKEHSMTLSQGLKAYPKVSRSVRFSKGVSVNLRFSRQ
jgi:hypothetical protein